jgi:cytochrome c556
MKKRIRQRTMSLAIGGGLLLAMLAGGIPSFGQPEEEEGLAALMQRIRQHFTHTVDMAYFQSLDRPLQPENYQWLRQEAQGLATMARQVRLHHSLGEDFDQVATGLEKHAAEVATEATQENLPGINEQLGEVAEYCAECHNAYRW